MASVNRPTLDDVLSDTAKASKSSSIRVLLRYATRNGYVYLAGGIPSPETFRPDWVLDCINDIFDEKNEDREWVKALQYTETVGYFKLIEMIEKNILPRQGVYLKTDDNEMHTIVTSGAQQGITILSKMFINKGDIIITEEPSYIGSLLAFRAREPDMRGVRLNDDGIDLNQLEGMLDNIYNKENKKIKFLYVIPDFQNPSGVTTSLEKRKAVLNLAEKYGFFIIEDSPYTVLRYEGENIPSLLSMDESGLVIQDTTFSKTGYPGFRIGSVSSKNADVIEKIEVMKQSEDLCCPAFTQAVWAKYIEKGYFDKNINIMIDLYSKKREWLLDALDKSFPDGDVKWTNIKGGLFLFVTFPEYINTDRDGEFFKTALEVEKVVYVPGVGFYPNRNRHNDIRVTFGFPSKEDIYHGIERLAETYKKLKK